MTGRHCWRNRVNGEIFEKGCCFERPPVHHKFDIALQGFHSAAGWWNMTLVALASVLATRRFGFFSRQPVSASVQLTDEQILLLPQLTLLFTASFDW